MVTTLQRAGLLAIARDESGAQTWTLRAEGVQVARQLSMSSEDDVVEVLMDCWRPRGRETPAAIVPRLTDSPEVDSTLGRDADGRER